MSKPQQPIIKLAEGWKCMERGIKKLENFLDGLPEDPFSPIEDMELYTTIYNMCTQKPPYAYSQELYDMYCKTLESYVTRKVLPSIREKHGEFMLRELVRGWVNYKAMVKWLFRFFHYLDRYFVARRSLPPLNDVGLTCFRNHVYGEVCTAVRDVVIVIMDREREGEQIDRTILKNGINMFIEIGMENYEQDFEAPMLEDSRSYYSRKAAKWVVEDSCPDHYMLKAEELLARERDRVSSYMHSSTEQKLVDVVQNEVLMVYANQLLEKEQSGCRALLRDNKVDDLSRIFRLYHKIPGGLELVSGIFKQHVTCECIALLQQAEDSARNQNSGAVLEQILVRKIIDLHDKYMAYVQDCFANHTLFHKALKESFKTFCNKKVGGSSSIELLAAFRDNVLKKGGSEKLSEEAIEDTLEKVVKLLAYLDDKDFLLSQQEETCPEATLL